MFCYDVKKTITELLKLRKVRYEIQGDINFKKKQIMNES